MEANAEAFDRWVRRELPLRTLRNPWVHSLEVTSTSLLEHLPARYNVTLRPTLHSLFWLSYLAC